MLTLGLITECDRSIALERVQPIIVHDEDVSAIVPLSAENRSEPLDVEYSVTNATEVAIAQEVVLLVGIERAGNDALIKRLIETATQ